MDKFLSGLALMATSGLVYLAYYHRVEYAAFRATVLIPAIYGSVLLVFGLSCGAMYQIIRATRRVEDRTEQVALQSDLDRVSRTGLVAIVVLILFSAFLQFLRFLPQSPS
jgi:hypothetical protein